MKRTKFDRCVSLRRKKWIRFLIAVAFLYLLLVVSFQVPFVFKSVVPQEQEEETPGSRLFFTDGLSKESLAIDGEEELQEKEAPIRPLDVPHSVPSNSKRVPQIREFKTLSNLNYDVIFVNTTPTGYGFGAIQASAKEAFLIGKRFWEELESPSINNNTNTIQGIKNQTRETCPGSITLRGSVFRERGSIIVLPCGMTLGSHITLVGRPREAHLEEDPKISLMKQMVSQFMMELQGLKTVDGEEPPRILHFNPRLKGDWSGKPVIEQNTCYRMQWGVAHRCEGWKSRVEEETVDGQVKCEKWLRDDDGHLEESKSNWWLNRVIGRSNKKVTIDWPFPFSEGKLFVLTLRAGLEGYHANVDGRHITSFPYRTVSA